MVSDTEGAVSLGSRHGVYADQRESESSIATGVRLKRANTMSFPLLSTSGRDGPASAVRIKRASSISLPLFPPPVSSSASPVGKWITLPEAKDQPRCSLSGNATQGEATVAAVMALPLATAAATDSTAASAASEKTHLEADQVSPGKGESGKVVKDFEKDDIGGDDTGGEVEGKSAVAVEVGSEKKELPLLLRPLAGRCSFPGCGKATVFRCSRCRSAFYCSRDHQRAHWKTHRAVCEEGKGPPPPPLARLVLLPPPLPPTLPSSRLQTKVVGWADSTQDYPNAPPPPYEQISAIATQAAAAAASFSGGSLKTRATGEVSRENGAGGRRGGIGGRGRGRGGRFGAGTPFRESRENVSLLEAGELGDSHLRTSRGGTAWNVPTSNGGRGGGVCGGSAEVWPASASSGMNAAVSGPRQRGRSASPSSARSPSSSHVRPPQPPVPPRPSPPRSKIPPPASRPPNDVVCASDVDMLLEMGFDRARATKALRSNDGNVERAAEWLLTTIDSGGACVGVVDDSCGGEIMHEQGAGDWGGGNGAASELRHVVETGKSGIGKEGDDDLITSADPADVGQSFDMSEFCRSESAVGSGAVSGAGRLVGPLNQGSWERVGGLGGFGGQGLGGMSGGRDEAKAVDDDVETNELIVSYEDCVGGASADIVVYYRQAGPAAASATPADVSRGDADNVTSTTAASSVMQVSARGVGDESGAGFDSSTKAVESMGGILTVIVRPHPSTAPASLTSDSSRGEDLERNDTSGDTEHVLTLPWENAENLALRQQEAQSFRLKSARDAAEASGAEVERNDTLHPSSWRLSNQPPAPLSPLLPSSRSSPSWRRKNKVGRLIAGMLERRGDGGFRAYLPEALEANPSDQVASSLVAYTHERPRGPEVPKWGDGYEDYPVGGRTPPRQSPPPPVSKWGSIGSGLTQAWDCPMCTFYNENPAYRDVCEICNNPRPVGASTGVFFPSHGGELSQLRGKASPPAHKLDVTTLGQDRTSLATLGAGLPSSSVPVAGPYLPDGVVAVGGSDDGEVVDGILGGVSPGGGASPVSATAVAMQESTGNVGSLKGVDWESGSEWQGFGSTSFGESP